MRPIGRYFESSRFREVLNLVVSWPRRDRQLFVVERSDFPM